MGQAALRTSSRRPFGVGLKSWLRRPSTLSGKPWGELTHLDGWLFWLGLPPLLRCGWSQRRREQVGTASKTIRVTFSFFLFSFTKAVCLQPVNCTERATARTIRKTLGSIRFKSQHTLTTHSSQPPLRVTHHQTRQKSETLSQQYDIYIGGSASADTPVACCYAPRKDSCKCNNIVPYL